MPLLTLLLPTLPIPPMPRPLVESTEQSDGDGASAYCRGKNVFNSNCFLFRPTKTHLVTEKAFVLAHWSVWYLNGREKTWPGLLSFSKTATKELLNHKCLLVKKGCRRRLLSLSSIFFFFFELPRSSCATSACVIYYIPSAGIIYIPAMPFGFFFCSRGFSIQCVYGMRWNRGTGSKKAHANGRSL